MELLLGKPIAETLLARTKERISQSDIIPGLAVVLIGDDEASRIYVELKEKAALSIGLHFEKHLLSRSASPEEALRLIETLNQRADIHGIIVQLPLPPGWDTDSLIQAIDPKKDADGFHPDTVRSFLSGEEDLPPVFPRAVQALVAATRYDFHGKQAVILGNSELFGSVMKKALETMGLIVRVSLLGNNQSEKVAIQEADVMVLARGNPHFLRGEMVKEGAIIIDGGITRVEGVVMSDALLESFASHQGLITPVPGGVGPVTVAMLLQRVTELALRDEKTQSILEA